MGSVSPYAGQTGNVDFGDDVIADIDRMIALPLVLQVKSNDAAYRVLAGGSEATPARLSLRVAFKRDMAPAQVVGLLDAAAASATVERVTPVDYLIVLPPSADVQAVSMLYDHLARQESVSSVQLAVKAQP
jgi:hypothetical protein